MAPILICVYKNNSLLISHNSAYFYTYTSTVYLSTLPLDSNSAKNRIVISSARVDGLTYTELENLSVTDWRSVRALWHDSAFQQLGGTLRESRSLAKMAIVSIAYPYMYLGVRFQPPVTTYRNVHGPIPLFMLPIG